MSTVKYFYLSAMVKFLFQRLKQAELPFFGIHPGYKGDRNTSHSGTLLSWIG
jgi:hypothetical protein